MSDLAAFLLARVEDDEAAAKAATNARWEPSIEIDGWRHGRRTVVAAGGKRVVTVDQTRCHHEPAEPNVDHIARWDPARVLAECAAKRALIGLHADDGPSQGYVGGRYDEMPHACGICGTHGEYGEYGEPWPCGTLRALAQPYTFHPLFRPEWATNAQED